MDLSQIRRVALFCPVGASGGPEAFHQLSHALTARGVECFMVYVGAGHGIEVGSDQIRCVAPKAEAMMQFYAAYRPRWQPVVPWDDSSLVVLPEGLALQHALFKVGRTAIWWLSVDNAYETAPRLKDPAVERALFSRPDLLHLYQSAYARDFLRSRGAPAPRELRDYTSPLFTERPVTTLPAQRACTYNAAKGGDIGQRFFEANPQLDGLALREFSKEQLRDLFSTRLVYIDFGHFPGQDRMAREAAACGSVAFIHRKGAGAVPEDFPLPDFFKFDAADIESGALARRLDAVMARPERHWVQQQPFRDMIADEPRRFTQQVGELFRGAGAA